MSYVRLLVLALVLVVVGCASAPTAEGGWSPREATRLTAEEIERVHYTSVYELAKTRAQRGCDERHRIAWRVCQTMRAKCTTCASGRMWLSSSA